MADNSFSKSLEIKVKGLQEVIDGMIEAGKVTQEAGGELSKFANDLSSSFDKASASTKKYTGELGEIQKAAQEAEKALRKMVEADIISGGKGDPSKLVGGLDPGAIRSAQQLKNYDTSSVVAANEKAQRSAQQLADSISKVNQALGNQRFEQSIQGLSALEQAQARYNRALTEQVAAGGKVLQTKGTDQEVKAQQDLAKAIDNTSRARAKLHAEETKESTRQYGRQAKEAEELARAEDRVAKAREAARKAIPQEGEDRVATARRNLEEATNELRAAEEHLAQIRSNEDVSTRQVTDANIRLESALKEHTRAQKELSTESERAINTLPRLRYALYDVSRTLTAMGSGMLGAATSVGVVSSKMSRDFADVIRTTEAFRDTTGQTAQSIRRDFEDLYTSLPADWGDITRIGEMAGQMNIAAQDVDHFTELVTKFAASTDVSVDSSATAFGRLSELLDVTADEYENLGSSILSVGVNSVATESQIIEISQQIAGIAGTAGLTADEVVGLSSALASIGTAPELSRGIVTRFFTNLMEATSQGGERLENFARVAGTSAEAFRTAWETDAAGAFQAVIKGLGQVEESEAINVLKELGIQQVRDIPAVLKLAQNYELLGNSMEIAAQGYSEGSALAEHYGVIADEMSSKIHVLKNQFALLLDALGQFTQSDFFKGLVDGATRALELLTALANSPIGKAMMGIGLAVSGAVGAFALLGASITALIASHAGLRTAMVNLAQNMRVTASAADLQKMKFLELLGVMGASEKGAKSLRIALGSIGVGLAFTALTYGLAKLSEGFQESSRYAEDMKTALSGIGDSILADTAAYEKAKAAGEDVAEAFTVIEVKSASASTEVDELDLAFERIMGTSQGTSQGLHEVADAADRATVALGKETVAALTKAMLAQDEFMDALKGGADYLDEYGFMFADYMREMVAGETEVAEYLSNIQEKINEAKRQYIESMAGADAKAIEKALEFKFKDIDAAMEAATNQVNAFHGSLNDLTIAEQAQQVALDALGFEVEDLEGAFDSAGEAADTFRSLLTGFDDTAYDLQGTFYDLADTIIRNGGAFDAFSVEGRNSMAALTSAMDDLWASADGDAVVFANNLAEAFAYVEGAGYNLIDSVDVLDQALDAAFGTEWRAHLDTSQAHQSVRSYLDAVLKALEAKAMMEGSTLATSMASAAMAYASGDFARGTAYSAMASQAQKSLQGIRGQISAVQGLQGSLKQAGNAGQQAGRRIHDSLSPKGSGRSGGRGAKDAQKAAKDLKKEVRTLQDYASDLASVWSRAFEIRFSGQQTLDSVTTSIRGMAERFSEAEQRVKDLRLQLQTLRGDMSGLQAELSKQQYFLSIATEYGDSARAEQIQARIIELQAELANKQNEVSKTSKELSKAQKETSRTLTGNSDAAIKNRADLMNLVKEYQDHIGALASSGMNSKELQRETERLRQDFIRQATQLGFNKKELDKYTRSFNDVRVAVNKVPRNVTVRANANPAIQAFREFEAKSKKNMSNVNKAISGVDKRLKNLSKKSYPGPRIKAPRVANPTNAANKAAMQMVRAFLSRYRRAMAIASIGNPLLSVFRFNKGGLVPMFSSGGQVAAQGPIYRASGGPAEWAKMYAKGTDTIPAMLTPGEYVVKKQAVDFYGPEVMRAINNMQVPKRFFTANGQMQGGAQASGTMSNGQRVTVDLSPSSVQAVAQAVQPRLVIDNKVIQQANGSANQRATSTGAR